jgi:hypothetical protein
LPGTCYFILSLITTFSPHDDDDDDDVDDNNVVDDDGNDDDVDDDYDDDDDDFNLQVKLWYNVKGQELIVTIITATNLPTTTKGQFRHPYCKVYMLPDRRCVSYPRHAISDRV